MNVEVSAIRVTRKQYLVKARTLAEAGRIAMLAMKDEEYDATVVLDTTPERVEYDVEWERPIGLLALRERGMKV